MASPLLLFSPFQFALPLPSLFSFFLLLFSLLTSFFSFFLFSPPPSFLPVFDSPLPHSLLLSSISLPFLFFFFSSSLLRIFFPSPICSPPLLPLFLFFFFSFPLFFFFLLLSFLMFIFFIFFYFISLVLLVGVVLVFIFFIFFILMCAVWMMLKARVKLLFFFLRIKYVWSFLLFC